MLDPNWELVDGQTAHDIELLNYTTQVNIIECLVKFALYNLSSPANLGKSFVPDDSCLRELHRAGTLFLLQRPGSYRAVGEEVEVFKDGAVIYSPPQSSNIPHVVTEFFQSLNDMWSLSDPLSIAAFALWRINWIHPFKNGNGRTARAFAYSCLCLKFGFVLPGTPTVIDLIMVNRPAYQAALAHADATLASSGKYDLAPMRTFLERLLVIQLSSVPPVTP